MSSSQNEKNIEIEIQYKKNYIHEYPFDYYNSQKKKLHLNKSLKDNLQGFYNSNGIVRKEKMFFYIMKKGSAIKEIDIEKPLEPIINELKNNKIIISPNKLKVNNNRKFNGNKRECNKNNNISKNDNSERIEIKKYTSKNLNLANEGIGTISKKKKFCFFAKIFVSIIIALIAFGIGLFFLLKKDKIKETIIIKEESLMTNINYKKGVAYLYKSEEKSDVISKKGNEVNTTNFIEYKNYLLLILEENNEQLNDLKKI